MESDKKKKGGGPLTTLGTSAVKGLVKGIPKSVSPALSAVSSFSQSTSSPTSVSPATSSPKSVSPVTQKSPQSFPKIVPNVFKLPSSSTTGQVLPFDEIQDPQFYDRLTDVQRFLLTLTFMDKLNNLPIGEEQKKVIIEKLKYISVKQIKNNAQRLIDIGVLPPFEEEVVGGGPEEGAPIVGTAPKARDKRATVIQKQKIKEAEEAATRLKKQQKIEARRQRQLQIAEFEEALQAAKFQINDILEVLQDENANYENLPESAKYLSLKVCEPRKAQEFRDILFPERAINEWCNKKPEQTEVEEVEEEEKEKCNARQIWELTNPQQQCANVVGEFKDIPEKDIRKNCYICGFEIVDTNNPRAGLSPECEHILPIIQAMFFLDLYRPNDKKLCNQGVLNPVECKEITETLKEEYGWSHRTCNQIKSDLYTFLQTKVDPTTKYPSWDFSENHTKQLLNAIMNTTKFDPGSIQASIETYDKKKGKGSWLRDRVEELRKIMKPIVTRIQSRGNGGFVAIIGLRNCLNVNKLNTNLRLVLGNYGYNPNEIRPSSPKSLPSTQSSSDSMNIDIDETPSAPASQSSVSSQRSWWPFGGTRTNKKRSVKLMKKGGEKRQRKLTEYGKMFQASLAKKEASNVKRKLTRKANAEVDELADIFGKLGTSPKKQTTSSHDIEMKYGGKKRRLTRRKSKKVSK